MELEEINQVEMVELILEVVVEEVLTTTQLIKVVMLDQELWLLNIQQQIALR